MPRAEQVLICALSGRALARSARAAGFAPIVFDAFGDLDTRAVAEAWRRLPVDGRWHFRKGGILAAARRMAPPPIPLVWGSGFESSPRLLAELSAGREHLGNSANIVRMAKDPADVRRNGGHAPDPPIRMCASPRPTSLPAGCANVPVVPAVGMSIGPGRDRPTGGAGIGSAGVQGESFSALVVGNGTEACVLGIAQQLVVARLGRPFRFAGTLAPARIPAAAREVLERAALRLARHYRLRGLASVDALVAGDSVTVIEINLRPGGSLDAYGAALGINLFAVHVERLPGRPGA